MKIKVKNDNSSDIQVIEVVELASSIITSVPSVALTIEDRKEIDETMVSKALIERQKKEAFFQGFELAE